MAVVSLNFLFNFGCFFVFLLTFYTWKFYANSKLRKANRDLSASAWDSLLAPNLSFLLFYIIWQLFFIFTSKTYSKMYSFAYMNLIIFILIFFFFVVCYLRYLVTIGKFRLENEVHISGCVWILFVLIVFLVIDNFVSFFLMLELISAIYFFFILVFMKSKTLTLIKLKNLVSNYLWISFFTLIVFFFALLLITKNCGALQFKQLYNISQFTDSYAWHLLLVAILWKIGGPGFYFFKLELYQYLPTASLLVFSIASSFVSCFLIHFIFVNCWPIFVAHQLGMIIYITVYNVFMLTRGLKTTTFYQFLALSSVNTWSVLLLFYLI